MVVPVSTMDLQNARYKHTSFAFPSLQCNTMSTTPTMPLVCMAGNVAVETCIIHYHGLHLKGSGKHGFSSLISMNANAESSVSQMASECLLLTTSDESPSLKGASHQAYSINNFRLCEFFNGPRWRKPNQRTSQVYQTYLSMLILEHTEQDR